MDDCQGPTLISRFDFFLFELEARDKICFCLRLERWGGGYDDRVSGVSAGGRGGRSLFGT